VVSFNASSMPGSKIRDRAQHLKEQFPPISRRVWDAYHAPTAAVSGNACAGCGRGRVRISRGWSWRGPEPLRGSAIVGRSRTITPVASNEQHARPADGGMNAISTTANTSTGSQRRPPAAFRSVGFVMELRALASRDTRPPRLRCPTERLKPDTGIHECWLANLLIPGRSAGYDVHSPQKT